MLRFAILLVLASCSHGSFRPFAAPKPIASPGAATAAVETCRTTGDADDRYERSREVAALDASLRADGGMLLRTYELGYSETREPLRVGDIKRGINGERLMVIAELESCGDEGPTLVAIDRSGDVFIAVPAAKARQTRTVRLCGPVCRGCGTRPPRRTLVAEVPDDASFVGTRTVTFPIDVQVQFVALDEQGQPMECEKIP